MRIDYKRQRGRRRAGALAVAVVAIVAAFVAGAGSAKTTAMPQNTALPTITGQAREGRALTAHNGTWSNSPTGFTYQWQQCDASGGSCSAISGATSGTYTAATGDVEHTIRVVVTATNADGSASATAKQTAVVSAAKAPVNTANPSISGTAKVGEALTASTGTWTGGVQSYAYQWQACDSSCTSIADATARTYGVRTVDQGKSIRVLVTATNLSGSASATSAQTATVTAAGGGTTTTHVPNHAPTISFVSLKRSGNRIYARFRLCDDSFKNVTVVARDTKAHVKAYTRRYSVAPRPCGTHTKNWLLPVRFRTHGRYTATLRAVDKSAASSRTVSRSLTFR